ncbi:hypothetical protein WDV90_12880 [Xanthomonas translucens pv. undulosa]|nr:hypothetical protein [Xanthomonas translucens]
MKSPLAAIRGAAELLQEPLPDASGDASCTISPSSSNASPKPSTSCWRWPRSSSMVGCSGAIASR